MSLPFLLDKEQSVLSLKYETLISIIRARIRYHSIKWQCIHNTTSTSLLLRARKKCFCLPGAFALCLESIPLFCAAPQTAKIDERKIGAKGKSAHTQTRVYKRGCTCVHTLPLARCFETHHGFAGEHISYTLTRALSCLPCASIPRVVSGRIDLRARHSTSQVKLSLRFSPGPSKGPSAGFVWAASYLSRSRRAGGFLLRCWWNLTTCELPETVIRDDDGGGCRGRYFRGF